MTAPAEGSSNAPTMAIAERDRSQRGITRVDRANAGPPAAAPGSNENQRRGRPDLRAPDFFAVTAKTSSYPGTPQPQGVADHRDRAEAHRGRRDDRTQQKAERRIEDACRHRHAGDVVDEGEEQILSDVRHGLMR